MEATKSKKNNKLRYPEIVIGLVITVFIAAVTFLITNRTETYTSGGDTNVSIGSLRCRSSNVTEPFFESPSALSYVHEVKVTFDGNGVDKLSYVYEGTYGSEQAADQARSEMHASYNKYMGSKGLDQESLYPTFHYDGATAKINLYAEREKGLNATTATLFFLNADEYVKINEYTTEALKKVYEEKGFSCDFDK